MPTIDEFIAAYSEGDESRIAFAWNGEHGKTFADANYDFRKQVLETVLSRPDQAPIVLIRDLYGAETRYSKEAWGVDKRVAQLASLLLHRGGPEFVEDYIEGKFQSMDAAMAAGAFEISDPLATALLGETRRRLRDTGISEQRRRRLEAGEELFAKLLVRFPSGRAVKVFTPDDLRPYFGTYGPEAGEWVQFGIAALILSCLLFATGYVFTKALGASLLPCLASGTAFACLALAALVVQARSVIVLGSDGISFVSPISRLSWSIPMRDVTFCELVSGGRALALRIRTNSGRSRTLNPTSRLLRQLRSGE